MGYLNEDGLATLVGKVKGQVVQLTAAEYRQIPAETKNTDNKIYFVEDDDYAYAIDNEPTLNSENLVKSGGVYNYTSKIGTGALTTTAQTLIPAVNELKAAVDTLNNGLIFFKNVQRTVTQNNTSDVWNMSTTFQPKSGYSRIIVGLRSDKQECIVTGWKYNENGEPQWMVRKLSSGSVVDVTYYATLLYMPDSNVWR